MLLLQEGVLLQFHRIVTTIILSAVFLGSVVHAGQERSVEDLSATAGNILKLVQHMQLAQAEDSSLANLRSQLILQFENLQVYRLLLDERLRSRETRLKYDNSVVRARNQEFSKLLNDHLQSIVALLKEIISQTEPGWEDLDKLTILLKLLVTTQQPPLHGTLPYRQLQLQTKAPDLSPLIIPAYQTLSIAHTSGDLKGAPEAPISQAIYQKAQAIAESAGKQNWDPVDLYEWVKNNVTTEWYWGSMKGAEETLRQRSGNDADQAALLIALLRAAGYPSRYVRGTVEFFPDLDMARHLTGIEDAVRMGDFFRKAGIPHLPVLAGSEVVNYQIEHVWVETLIPYANYRGSLADMEGKVWLPLDTSFKVAGFLENGELDLYGVPEQPLLTLRDDYLSESQGKVPIEVIRENVASFLAGYLPSVQYNSILHRRIQQSENLHIISTMPQFTEVAITGEYQFLPDSLVHKVRFSAVDAETGSLPVFDLILPVRELTSQLVQISFEPETVEDQETINLWGGLDNTPGYLVYLRPVLIVNDVRMAGGQRGFPVGKDFTLKVTMLSPAGDVEVENRIVIGYPQLLGIVAQDVRIIDEENENDRAVDFLYRTAMDYVDSWNRDEQEMADLLNLKIARPLSSLVTLGGMMNVTELLGYPQSVTWTGLFMDADVRVAEAVVRNSTTDNRQLSFMQLSSLQGSVLEHQVIEKHFQVESISTAKLFGLARGVNLPILTINAENVSAILAELDLSQSVREDITAAVDVGMFVQIPAQPLTYSAWTGTGYLKESAETGEAGYMLSGAIAGGNTVLGKAFWPETVVRTMERPYRGKPNNDITAAHSLDSITPWEVRLATAGEVLSAPLMVRVKDALGVPVAGAPVAFTVNKGVGTLIDDSVEPGLMVQSLTVTSDYDGIARAGFVPGKSVYSHPIVLTRPDDEQANIVGENLITAQLAAGSLVALDDPIIVLGFAGQPDLSAIQVIGDGEGG